MVKTFSQTAAGLNFGDKTIRRGFIRKVYSILSLQLILTGAMIAYFVFLLPQHVQYPQCQEVGAAAVANVKIHVFFSNYFICLDGGKAPPGKLQALRR